MDLAPPTVACCSDGGEREVPAAEVPVGARFVVKPGERIPLDGRVVDGTSDVNQAPITGESVPVPKAPGDEVFAGTINGDGALTIESTKPAEDTTLARIIRMVDEAQSPARRREQWVERFARVYTPAVMVLAIVVAVVPPLLFGVRWRDWFYRALVLLVIACPCALVISTPVSIVAALAAAARHGVLVKGGLRPGERRRASGRSPSTRPARSPRAGRAWRSSPLSGHTDEELLERAAALEARSEHPLARAILDYAADAEASLPTPADDFQVVQGKGVTGRVRRPRVLARLASLPRRARPGDGRSARAARKRCQAHGQTVVVVGNDDHVCGLIALADAVRPDAAASTRRAARARASSTSSC